MSPYSIAEDGTLMQADQNGVLGNDIDADFDVLTATLLTGPAHGVLAFNPDGSFTYTPNANFFGTDSFTYNATMARPTNVATVTLTVNAVNELPVAVTTTAIAGEDAR